MPYYYMVYTRTFALIWFGNVCVYVLWYNLIRMSEHDMKYDVVGGQNMNICYIY